VGRCCESGDILQENVSLPADTKRGELLAVLTTGAYNYSMSSNYNRIPRPPVVMLAKGTHTQAVRRESFADIAATVAQIFDVSLDTPGQSFASQIL
jgi:diaminopimelate decarboxylase